MVAGQRGGRLLAQLALLVGVAEARAPPAGVEQRQELGQRAELVALLLTVVALEHLMHGDPEALVQGRLLRDPEHARELVAQRARAVGVDVGGRQQHAVAAHRQEALERGLVAGGDHVRAAAHVALGVEQVLVERRAREDLALVGRDRLLDPHVDVAQRLRHALPVADVVAGDQRRQLQQLEVADDGVRDVEVGVESQLGEPPGGARRALHQLVAQQPVGRVQRLGRAEQILGQLEPLAAERIARRLDRRQRRHLRAALAAGRVHQHRPLARA